MYDWTPVMNELESKMCDWLNKNPKIIIDSFKTFSPYDYIKITYVDFLIDSNNTKFSCHVKYSDKFSNAVSPYLDTPKEFLRQIKLERITNETRTDI